MEFSFSCQGYHHCSQSIFSLLASFRVCFSWNFHGPIETKLVVLFGDVRGLLMDVPAPPAIEKHVQADCLGKH